MYVGSMGDQSARWLCDPPL